MAQACPLWPFGVFRFLVVGVRLALRGVFGFPVFRAPGAIVPQALVWTLLP